MQIVVHWVTVTPKTMVFGLAVPARRSFDMVFQNLAAAVEQAVSSDLVDNNTYSDCDTFRNRIPR